MSFARIPRTSVDEGRRGSNCLNERGREAQTSQKRRVISSGVDPRDDKTGIRRRYDVVDGSEDEAGNGKGRAGCRDIGGRVVKSKVRRRSASLKEDQLKVTPATDATPDDDLHIALNHKSRSI